MNKKNFFVKLVSKFYFPGLGNKIFNKVNLSKVFIIFTLGFISRVLVNNIFDVNNLTEYVETITVVYYSFLVFLIGSINDLPKINMEVFNIPLVRKAISSLVSMKREEMTLNNVGDKSSSSYVKDLNSVSKDKLKIQDVLFMGDKISKDRAGSSKSNWPYPGLQGLYGDKGGTRPQLPAAAQGLYTQINGAVIPTEDLSKSFRIKRRLFWYTWKRFTGEYSSFENFKDNYPSQLNFRKEIKKDIKNVLANSKK